MSFSNSPDTPTEYLIFSGNIDANTFTEDLAIYDTQCFIENLGKIQH